MLQKKLKVKDINLLDVYKKKKEPSKYASLMKYAIPPILLAILIVGTFGYLTIQSNGVKNDITEIKSKVQELEKKIALDPNQSKVTSLQTMQDNVQKYSKLYEDIQSYPQISQRTFDQLLISAYGVATITDLSFTRGSQSVTVNIETSSESLAERFVRNLKASGEFANVLYSGYTATEKSQDDSTTSSNNTTTNKIESVKPKETVYIASIECILK